MKAMVLKDDVVSAVQIFGKETTVYQFEISSLAVTMCMPLPRRPDSRNFQGLSSCSLNVRTNGKVLSSISTLPCCILQWWRLDPNVRQIFPNFIDRCCCTGSAGKPALSPFTHIPSAGHLLHRLLLAISHS